MLLFGICGSTYGMMETVPFYILLAATMYAAGFDTLTGALGWCFWARLRAASAPR